MKVKFPDGVVIMQEPTGQDPCVYYLPAGGDWSRAIGLTILPLYEEDKARSVTIRLIEGNGEQLARLRQMGNAYWVLIIQRYAHTLSKKFSRWKELRVEFPEWLMDCVGEIALIQLFLDAGWHLRSRDVKGFQLGR